MEDEMESFIFEFVTETDGAILVEDDTGKYWLPKSQIDYNGGEYEKGDEIAIDIPEWLAEEKGLI